MTENEKKEEKGTKIERSSEKKETWKYCRGFANQV